MKRTAGHELYRSHPHATDGSILTRVIACTIIVPSGEGCGALSSETAPFPICDRHMIDVYRYVAMLIGHQHVAVHPRLPGVGKRTVGQGMNGWRYVVYYAHIGDHIKIGRTKNLTERMKWYPPSARLLAVEPGGEAVEAERHRQFGHLLAARDEWFDPGPDLLAHIERLAGEGLPPAPIVP